MKFCVCGGGNGAHAFAAVLGSNGVEVSIYTPLQDEVDKWNAGGLSMTATFKDGSSLPKVGIPRCVTADPKEAVGDADIILICLPTFLHEPTLMAVGPHLKPGSFIGTIEGCWWGKPPLQGADWMKNVTFYALQTLPWAARLMVYGKSVEILGVKDVISVACSPARHAKQLADMLTPVIEVKMRPITNLISLLALDPSNIIHPGIMYGKLHDWDGKPFKEAPLFYQGVDDCIAKVMIAMDADVLAIRDEMKRRYPDLDLSGIQPTLSWLHEAYPTQIKDRSTFASSFATNSAYAGLRFPVKPAPDGQDGVVPLFDYRYLSADVPYGIVVIRGIGELLGVATPALDKAIIWAQQKLGKEYLVDGKLTGKSLAETRAPQKFDITDAHKFMESVLL